MRRVDPDCPCCRGTGEVLEEKCIDGEWWGSFSSCFCVTYDPLSDRQKKAVESALVRLEKEGCLI